MLTLSTKLVMRAEIWTFLDTMLDIFNKRVQLVNQGSFRGVS